MSEGSGAAYHQHQPSTRRTIPRLLPILLLPSTHWCLLPLPRSSPYHFLCYPTPLPPEIPSSLSRPASWERSELRHEEVGINFPDMSVWVYIRDTSLRGHVLYSSQPHSIQQVLRVYAQAAYTPLPEESWLRELVDLLRKHCTVLLCPGIDLS